MRSSEVRAAGALVADAAEGSGRFIGDVHEAIAGRPFGSLGLLGAPVRAVHDRVSHLAYRAVSGALAAPPRAAASALSGLVPGDGPPLSGSLRGSLALGALNGAIGDELERSASALALEMRFRRDGCELDLDTPSLARAHPRPQPRLAIFVHGLCETDEAWRLQPLGGPRRTPYGERLENELGYTSLYVRYNTGAHISDNGSRLAELVGELVERWPVPVEEIVLLGHSMGGLVARGALAREGDWTALVRHVFCLGSPHLGAPLEKATNVLAYVLARLPETRPLAKIVNGRSVGIKDLRFGSCAEEDWCDCDPDEFLKDRCHEVAFRETAIYYFIGATLSRSRDSLVGDLLVRFPSASGSGRRRRLPFEVDNGRHFTGMNHFQLLNDPGVYDQIAAWIDRAGRRLLAA